MPVKPERAHVRAWDEGTLTLLLGWENQLSKAQRLLLEQLHTHFMGMDEIESVDLDPDPEPSSDDGVRLACTFVYDRVVVGNDDDSLRQRLEQRIESDVQDVLFGDAEIDQDGVITRPSPARPAHIIQV